MDRDTHQQAAPSPAADDPARAADARDAFSELYEAHATRVYRYLLSRTSSVSDAEELTSRTFANAFASLGSYRGRGKFESWLMTIAHNLLANWYRDRGRRPQAAPLDEALAVPRTRRDRSPRSSGSRRHSACATQPPRSHRTASS